MISELFSMGGRVSRSYWWLVGWSLNIIFIAAWSLIAWLVGDYLFLPISLFWIVPILMVQFYMKLVIDIKRLHDLNHTGMWALLYFLYLVPVVNIIVMLVRLIYLGFFRGNNDSNPYGKQGRTGGDFFFCK